MDKVVTGTFVRLTLPSVYACAYRIAPERGGHAGFWKSSMKGRPFGMLAPGTVRFGARFHQEVAPGIGPDQSRVMNSETSIMAPIGLLSPPETIGQGIASRSAGKW
jgi:hypothetical protein